MYLQNLESVALIVSKKTLFGHDRRTGRTDGRVSDVFFNMLHTYILHKQIRPFFFLREIGLKNKLHFWIVHEIFHAN